MSNILQRTHYTVYHITLDDSGNAINGFAFGDSGTDYVFVPQQIIVKLEIGDGFSALVRPVQDGKYPQVIEPIVKDIAKADLLSDLRAARDDINDGYHESTLRILDQLIARMTGVKL